MLCLINLISSASLAKAQPSFHRIKTETFKLSDDGMKSRFSTDDKVHIDRIYKLLYPEKDNTAYRDDPNRVNRRQNIAQSKYDIEVQINGPLHVQLMSDKRLKDN